MKTNVLLRKIHHWGSILIALPLGMMIGAGILLMLKKEVDWIQPPTVRGATPAPSASFEDLLAAAASVPEAAIRDWHDLDRVDVKPGKGIVKFVANNRWEVQVDAATARVLHVAYRRSDLIEDLHDGSFFADWTKLYLFLPSGVILFTLWLTGLYLFFLPHVKNMQKRRRKRTKSQQATPQ